MILSRVKEATKEFIKVLRFGKSDVQTADQCLPHGIDSKPVKEDLAIWTRTSSSEQSVVLGYLKESDRTNSGETRIYATDSLGVDQFDIKLTNSGQCELGGKKDNAVRYSPLNKGLQDFINNLNAELIKIQTGISSAGGAYTPANQQIDISNSKIDEIETL